jgi:hypothetical protein
MKFKIKSNFKKGPKAKNNFKKGPKAKKITIKK